MDDKDPDLRMKILHLKMRPLIVDVRIDCTFFRNVSLRLFLTHIEKLVLNYKRNETGLIAIIC